MINSQRVFCIFALICFVVAQEAPGFMTAPGAGTESDLLFFGFDQCGTLAEPVEEVVLFFSQAAITVTDPQINAGVDTLNFRVDGPLDDIPSFRIFFANCSPGTMTCDPFTEMDPGGNPISATTNGATTAPAQLYGTKNLIFPLGVDFLYNNEDLAIKFIFANYAGGAGVFGNPSAAGQNQAQRDCRPDANTEYPNYSDFDFGTLDVPAFSIANCMEFSNANTCSDPGNPGFTAVFDECFADIPDATLTQTTGDVTVDFNPMECPLFLSTSGFDPNQEYPVGTNNVINTVTSPATGASIQCPTTFSVTDDQNPEAFCAGPPDVTLDPRFCEIIIPPFSTFDNCPGETAVQSFNPALPASPTQVTVDVTDASGNMGFCSYNLIILNPFTFPNCPAGTVQQQNDPGKCSANINFETEVGNEADQCPEGTLYTNYDPEGDDYPVGTVEFVAVSHAGNDVAFTCTFDVRVTDVEAPQLICPEPITVTATSAAGAQVFYADPIVVDNCPSNVNVVPNGPLVSGSIFPVGETTVTYVASDTSPGTGSCVVSIFVNPLQTTDTPTQTVIFLPTPSVVHSPTRGTISPVVSRDQVSPSFSPTGSRSNNPSTSPTPSPPVPPPSASAPPSASPSRSRIPPSPSNSPSPSFIPPPLQLSASDTRSPYIPSASPSSTPAFGPQTFVQVGDSVLVEIIIPCARTVCTVAEAQFYLNEIALQLDILVDDVRLVSLFGNEVTFLVCGSTETAALLNRINLGAVPGFDGVFVESANFDVTCDQLVLVESSSDATTLIISVFSLLLGTLL